MSNLIENELHKYGIFETEIHPFIEAVANSIPSRTIPDRMKHTIAVSEIMRFVSQFKIHIQHWNSSLIPINSIAFCIAKSGASKDSSMNACRKCFKRGYELIEEYRLEEAKDKAIDMARNSGLDDYDTWKVYRQFYEAPAPLVVGVSTMEGFLQYLSDLGNNPIGTGSMFSGEFGGELASNPNMSDIIKTISELYDEGNKELKVLKDKTKQTQVNNIAVSAMFMGSQDNILYDEQIKRRFKMEFSSKLARRSMFIFVDEEQPEEIIESIDDILYKDKSLEDNASKNREEVSSYVSEELFNSLMDKLSTNLKIDDEVINLFHLYKRYNEEEAKKIDAQYPVTRLTRQHLQWKAFKLAGAIALTEMCDTIEVSHYVSAIRFIETTSSDILAFEKELIKEPYEVFASHVRDMMTPNSVDITLSLHNLRKLGYVPLRGSPTTKLKELVQLVSSYDNDGSYRIEDDNIVFTPIIRGDNILISYVNVSGTKEQRASQCARGYVSEILEFTDLENVLHEDLAYTPFSFTNGIRGKDNINSSCKWLVLDIDDTSISDQEASLLLEDIKHIIVRTSNKDNAYKYRIILELDAEVNIPDRLWNHFIRAVATEIGFKVDRLPKAQIFFSYKDSADTIQTNFEASPLAIKPILDSLQDIKQTISSNLSKPKQKELLNNPLETFEYAFNSAYGSGSRNLIRAARHAKDLGASKEEIIELMCNINYEYWTDPIPEERFENTILKPIREKWEF